MRLVKLAGMSEETYQKSMGWTPWVGRDGYSHYPKLYGIPEEILEVISFRHPEVRDVLARVRELVPQTKREIAPYQAAVLYALARPLDFEGARALEIGTALGYSCAVMASAAPRMRITTLNPKRGEYEEAVKVLDAFGQVEVVRAQSRDYLWKYEGAKLDFIFVDGDHKKIREDLPWYGQLKTGGLILFHDYSPQGSGRPTPTVYEALNEFRAALGREFDVEVIDHRAVGMVGYYRREESCHMPT